MKNVIGLLSLVVAGSASAEFVVVNNPVVETVGFYSDAFSSDGAYTYAQSGAQLFDLEDSYTTSSIKWWGSSNGFNNQGVSNFTSFEINVWDAGFNGIVYTTTVDMSNVEVNKTGDSNFFGQPVYEFYVPFVAQLTAGSYAMNIGVNLEDANGDQFVWSQGADSNNFWQTSPFGPGGWGSWRPLPPSIGNTAGGAFVLSAPSPAAIALLGLAGLVAKRRR
jgi:hypothetical protein